MRFCSTLLGILLAQAVLTIESDIPCYFGYAGSSSGCARTPDDLVVEEVEPELPETMDASLPLTLYEPDLFDIVYGMGKAAVDNPWETATYIATTAVLNTLPGMGLAKLAGYVMPMKGTGASKLAGYVMPMKVRNVLGSTKVRKVIKAADQLRRLNALEIDESSDDLNLERLFRFIDVLGMGVSWLVP